MNPALSVVLFTTLASAGLGVLAWLGLDLALATNIVARDRIGIALVVGLVLLAAGLVASTAHLGVKSRAWRAFSQWRSSWLSREAWLALLVFVPAGLVLLSATGLASVPERSVGAVLAVLAAATLYATTKIYTTLAAIPAWADALVAPAFVLLGLAAGATWMLALAHPLPHGDALSAMAAVLWVAGALAKLGYWRRIDRQPLPSTRESATGLGRFGQVSVFESPHTEANFLLREMGYVLARKHGRTLRAACIGAMLACAALLAAAAAVATLRPWAAVLALVSGTLAVFVERWLFFAQARHVVTLYYGADPRAVADQSRPSSAPAP